MAFLRPSIEHISFSIKPLRFLKGDGWFTVITLCNAWNCLTWSRWAEKYYTWGGTPCIRLLNDLISITPSLNHQDLLDVQMLDCSGLTGFLTYILTITWIFFLPLRQSLNYYMFYRLFQWLDAGTWNGGPRRELAPLSQISSGLQIDWNGCRVMISSQVSQKIDWVWSSAYFSAQNPLNKTLIIVAL
jgi:hypothetical protein